jgi:hypothetical protein
LNSGTEYHGQPTGQGIFGGGLSEAVSLPLARCAYSLDQNPAAALRERLSTPALTVGLIQLVIIAAGGPAPGCRDRC